ncbi:MAG: magnesium chelatase subunit D family protein [Candidatus Odinarchaeia archaeon]
MPHHIRFVFPFSAIVGQEKMKKALLLNAINPRIGGVLIRGEKGTGKSTAVRALAELLPQIKVVKDCPFNCNPDDPSEMCDLCYEKYKAGKKLPWVSRKVRIVNLPLNSTVDRVAGTIDIKKAIEQGIKALDPGLLAEANRGILYIDEVNLLDDYITDILLDVAASGINIIERESISIIHPSRFILVGTMNPEEGELRPQLLDRFALQVDVEPITDPDLQVEIVKRVEEFENNPEQFTKKYESMQHELRNRIMKAQQILPNVHLPEELLRKIAKVCAKLAVSNRAIIVISKTAKTIAAFNGELNVSENDVMEAMELALPHRMRRKPFEKPSLSIEDVHELFISLDDESKLSEKHDEKLEKQNKGGKTGERVFKVGATIPLELDVTPLKRRKMRVFSGRRTSANTATKRGAYVYSTIPKGEPVDIAVDATIRAAAARYAGSGCPSKITIGEEDIREKVRRSKISTLLILVVDASGSMAAFNRMEAAKGAVMGLLQNAYINRDKIAFIAFRGNAAQLLLPPTGSLNLAANTLVNLPTGGKTPLSHALLTALNVIKTEKAKKSNIQPLVVLVSDGKANVPLQGEINAELTHLCMEIRKSGALFTVIDTSTNPFAPSYLPIIIDTADAKHYKISHLTRYTLQKVIERDLATINAGKI